MKRQKLPLDVLDAVAHAYDKDVLDVFVRDGTAYASDGFQAAWCKVSGVPDGTYHKTATSGGRSAVAETLTAFNAWCSPPCATRPNSWPQCRPYRQNWPRR
jgi:hypothetical protein